MCGAMTDDDKMTFGLFTDPEKIINGLMQIYGSEADIVPAKIKEMRSLKPPKSEDYPHIQRNLHKLKLCIQYIQEQGESARLEANVVHKIVNASLDWEQLKRYNMQFNWSERRSYRIKFCSLF